MRVRCMPSGYDKCCAGVIYYPYETIVDYLNWLFNAGIAISLEAIIYYMSGYTVIL